MATLELSILAEHFDDDEIAAIAAAVEEASSHGLDVAEEGESVILERDIDDDIFVDFQDRLDANDASADVYLPVDFEEILEIGDVRFGSAHALLIVLEALKEDFFVEDDQDDDDDEVEVEDDVVAAPDTDADADDGFDFTDDDEAGGFFSDDESPIEMKDEQLKHVWRAMYKGAQSSVRKALCMFVKD